MITPKQVEKLFSKPSKEAEELERLYRDLAIQIAKRTRPNDLSKEALILLRESFDKLKASIALSSEDEPY